jgi:biotin transport system substrate-specific component
MTSRASSVTYASSLLDQVSLRAATPRSWTGVRALAVIFVTSLTAAASQISIPLPFTPVPFTLQPMVVLVGAAALGARLGAASQILYLMLGLAGLPVFAYAPELPPGGFRLLGPTGGYLLAYPAAAFVTGWLAERGMDRRLPTSLAAMSVGLGTIYLSGVLWLAQSVGLQQALALGFYPFVLVDLIKIAASGALLPGIWRLLARPD